MFSWWNLRCQKVLEEERQGKRLFELGCDSARGLKAEKLYISAHSSKESQAAYKALGCVHAEEINRKLAEEEPCDVQMEYVLQFVLKPRTLHLQSMRLIFKQ